MGADRAADKDAKREAELERKKQNQELYESEMAEASAKPKAKKGNANATKVTRAQILAAQMAALESGKKGKKLVEQSADLEENINKLDLGEQAQNVDEALALLGGGGGKAEKPKMKAAFNAFEQNRYREL